MYNLLHQPIDAADHVIEMLGQQGKFISLGRRNPGGEIAAADLVNRGRQLFDRAVQPFANRPRHAKQNQKHRRHDERLYGLPVANAFGEPGSAAQTHQTVAGERRLYAGVQAVLPGTPDVDAVCRQRFQSGRHAANLRDRSRRRDPAFRIHHLILFIPGIGQGRKQVIIQPPLVDGYAEGAERRACAILHLRGIGVDLLRHPANGAPKKQWRQRFVHSRTNPRNLFRVFRQADGIILFRADNLPSVRQIQVHCIKQAVFGQKCAQLLRDCRRIIIAARARKIGLNPAAQRCIRRHMDGQFIRLLHHAVKTGGLQPHFFGLCCDVIVLNQFP